MHPDPIEQIAAQLHVLLTEALRCLEDPDRHVATRRKLLYADTLVTDLATVVRQQREAGQPQRLSVQAGFVHCVVCHQAKRIEAGNVCAECESIEPAWSIAENLRGLIRSEAGHIAYVDDMIDDLLKAKLLERDPLRAEAQPEQEKP
jgi:hypothetical protein